MEVLRQLGVIGIVIIIKVVDSMFSICCYVLENNVGPNVADVLSCSVGI